MRRPDPQPPCADDNAKPDGSTPKLPGWLRRPRRYIPKAGDSALDQARIARAEAKRRRRAAGRTK